MTIDDAVEKHTKYINRLEEMAELTRMVDKAIEKQIPFKPVFIKGNIVVNDRYICSECKKTLEYYRPPYCEWCGQRQEWENE